MALFGKKTNPKEAAPDQAAAPVDDFSPEALAALAASMESESGASAAGVTSQVRRPVSFKNGSVLGLNVGADSIKAIELTAKNGSCAITGLGIAPTPPDSIANGVVMSVNVLGEAIKDLLANNGLKNRKAVTSVAGTGEVIVRVIEVPTMTDAELAENIKTDLDRYIPFPPSEVQWDAAGMRDLPTDPSATNMDVLLVAARHELIDLHLELLESVKLDPRAIDVEPLAAARAVAGPLSAENPGLVDYNDVCAVLDIGASSTEISILRGDELVFTRTLPIAGNMMTQALMDQLNLTHTDAERMKREMGDALPPESEAPAVQNNTPVAAADDSDALAGMDETPEAAGQAEEATDPFDIDIFNQGSQEEPGEQHQQKVPDGEGADDEADLPSKSAPEGPLEEEDTGLPSKQADAAPAGAPASGAIASFFEFDDDDLDEQSEQLPTIQGQPQHTEAPPREEDSQQIAMDDDSFLPSLTTPIEPNAPVPSAFAFPGESVTPPVVTPGVPPVGTPPDKTSESTFEPLSIEKEEAPVPDLQAPVEEDIDLSDILGDAPTETPAIDEVDAGLGSSVEETDTSALGDLTGGLGAGLEVEDRPLDEHAVNAVLKPILADLTSELRRSLEYHSARYPDVPVTRLLLIGGGAKLRNLDAYFTQNLGIPTSLRNPLEHVKLDAPQVNPQLVEQQGSAFAVALGLALRELIK